MSSLLILCSILLVLVVQHAVTATDYTVGDDNGWTTGTNYLTWSEKYNFTVGDVLVFRYLAGQHDVFEVTEETYRSCNSSSGVLNRYASGDDRVVLADPKRYWFICNTSGHCLGGMKFGVSVANLSSEAAPTPPPPPSQGGAAAGGGLSWWSSWLLLGLTIGVLGLPCY